MTAVLAKIEPISTLDARESTHAFEPRSIDECVQLAKILVASRLLPKSVGTAEAAFAIIATGRELGLTAMQSLRSIHVIDGKPTLSADLGAALVKKHPSCRFFRLVESTEKIATYETHRQGEPSPTRMSFSLEDANRAGVTSKDPWKKYPAAMLRARCIMALARAVYPDAMLAVYDPDELGVPEYQGSVSQVVEPPPTSAAKAALAEKFAERIDLATSTKELAAIGKEVAAAHKEKHITDGDRTTLLKAYNSASAALKKAPPSAPKVTEDGEVLEEPEAPHMREPGED